MCGDEADLQGWNQFNMQRFSESDTGTQMIKGPLSLLRRQLPLLRGAMLRCTSNRYSTTGTPYYTVRQTGYFHSKKSNTELMTGSGFCPESYEETLIDRSYQFVEMPIHRTACFYT